MANAHPQTTKLQDAFHGAVELFAFLGASAYAVILFWMGRWPEAPHMRMRRKAMRAKGEDVEKAAPLPANDWPRAK